MKKWKSIAGLCMAGLLVVGSLSACSQGTNVSTNDNSIAVIGGSFSGTVTAVTDSTITLKVSTGSDMGKFDPTQMGGGQMPSDMGGGQMPSDMTGGQMPGGDSDNLVIDPNSTSAASENSDENAASDSADNAASDNADANTSSEASDNSDTNTPPEKPSGDSGEAPSGEAPSGNSDTNTPPEIPSGDAGQAPSGETPSGDSGEAPSGDAADNGSSSADASDDSAADSTDADGVTVVITVTDESIITKADGTDAALSDIAVDDTLTVTVDANSTVTAIVIEDSDSTDSAQGGNVQGGGEAPSGNPGGGSASGVDSYSAVTTYSEDTTVSGESYSSTGSDENAILVDSGSTVTVSDATVDRTSSDSTGGDNSSFYGVGAAVLNTDGTLYLSDSTITTNSAGGAGVFSYGDGVTYVSNTTISTEQGTSGGIHVAGGGTLYAWDVTATTNGASSAAIRSDRGGGTMVVDGGTYTSNGSGSPAVYCTADITVNDATLTATGSEAVCIEGLNTLRLYDCDLTGNMPENEQNDCTWNVIVYQSMSGDSEVGNGSFYMEGGTLTAGNGGIFYTTNTDSTFYLSDVDITYAEENDFFLKVTGNSNARGWGSAGSNGSQCNFTADSQAMEGNIIWDTISTLDFYMENGSTLTGAVVDDESNAGNGGDGYCNMYISSDSTWIATGDSTVTNLNNEGTIVDADGNTVSVVGTDGTVFVEGTSAYTVTVNTYSDSADFSGASTGSDFSDYAVTNPFEA